MVSMSDGSMERSSRASTRRRGLLLTIVLGAALQLANAPQAFAAITFVKNVGFLADNTTGTTISVTVPAGGVAFGHTVLVSFAIDPVGLQLAEVVERWLWIAELGGLSRAFECFAGDLAFEAGAVSAGEQECVRGEPGAAAIDELE